MKDSKLSKKNDFTSLRPPTKPMAQHMVSKGRFKSTVEKKGLHLIQLLIRNSRNVVYHIRYYVQQKSHLKDVYFANQKIIELPITN